MTTSQDPAAIEREVLDFDADGTPRSARYGDVYASRAGAAAQSRAVFLAGCGLLDAPRSWAGRRQFVVLETGFGLGSNFLATWQAWRDDAQRPDVLHYVAVELHPVDAATLRATCVDPALQPLAEQLARAWPPAVRGLHPLHFDGGRVRLTLALGDVAQLLPQLELGADAIYLDGFSPERNPAMWQPEVLAAVGRLARPAARLASYTVARAVRDGLEHAGFELRREAGFGGKAQRLQAVYAPRWRRRRVEPRAARPATAARDALVVGAALAGAATARSLRARGWSVTLLDAGGELLPAGLAHLRESRDDNHLTRLSRCGLAWLRGALPAGCWIDGGVLIAEAGTAPLPAAGAALRCGGRWNDGGVAAAGTLLRAWLAEAGVTPRRAAVHALRRDDDGCWCALATDGSVLARAGCVVLANALDAPRLLGASALHGAELPLRGQRGQGFVLPDDALPGLRGLSRGVMAHTYAMPLPDAPGQLFIGATYEDAAAPALDAEQVWAHIADGLQPLSGQLPATPPASARLFCGMRAVTPDRRGAIGAWPDFAALRTPQAPLREWPRLTGVHLHAGLGSRGLVMATLGAELIAAELEGEPAPLERELLDALAPGRFARRARLRAG
jgi:tRNA 5-methylaminomethyl-2-thiouridine biosynthesis bifunctional protein